MALKAKKQTRNSQQKEQALIDVSTENTKRINANVPASLHAEFKSKAAINGDSINELILKWVNEYLK
jgi:predicted HicB family RNase H-like nuclease